MAGNALTIGSFGLLLGPPLASSILQHTGSWLGLQLFSAGMLVLAGITLAAARVYYIGWNPLRKA